VGLVVGVGRWRTMSRLVESGWVVKVSSCRFGPGLVRHVRHG
jgi:hypothetical protein